MGYPVPMRSPTSIVKLVPRARSYPYPPATNQNPWATPLGKLDIGNFGLHMLLLMGALVGIMGLLAMAARMPKDD